MQTFNPLKIQTAMKKLITLVFFLGILIQTQANNIQVANISLENLNEAQSWVHVEFDLTWENSWRVDAGPSNWDAAWVFVKYRANSGDWAHANLGTTDFNAPTGSEIKIAPQGIGAIIQRDSNGTGDVDFTDIQLRWNYGSVNTSDILDIQVFAIEMVYVPEGAFYVGGTTGDEANKFHEGGNTNTSYQVTSENPITIANSAGNLYYVDSGVGTPGDQTGTLDAEFPKGYGAYYCMKYEVSQAQWIAFFNTLTESQKLGNDITDAEGKNSDAEISRISVSWAGGTANATTTNPDVPVSYVRISRMKAYLDWSGLRPMTELEFEKACRGPILPKAGEFAWGSANISSNDYTFANIGETNESITNLEENTGNAIYNANDGTLTGPKRCGILAASAVNKTREETGGSYYGIMELSGNLYERCITVGTSRGRTFSGIHGNGIINSSGAGTVINWPFDDGDGLSYRGASHINGPQFLRVSDRQDGANGFPGNNNRIGFRGVRTDF